jgi:hypothetical protein
MQLFLLLQVLVVEANIRTGVITPDRVFSSTVLQIVIVVIMLGFCWVDEYIRWPKD